MVASSIGTYLFHISVLATYFLYFVKHNSTGKKNGVEGDTESHQWKSHSNLPVNPEPSENRLLSEFMLMA